MFKYILLCTLLAHAIWAKPVHQHAELAPHVLILTPQAQLRLESLIPGTPIIQHLSPFTRFIAPHEETIVYVPTSAAASIQPLHYTEVVARSLPSSGARQDYNQIASNAQEAILAGGSQLQEALQSGFQNAGTLIGGSTSSFAPGGIDYSPVVQGLTSAASAAAAAGSSLAGAASFAPGGIDYSPVVQGLTSAASAAAAAAQSAGSSLAGAASFAPSDPNALVQGFLEQGPNVLSSATNAATAAAASAGSSFVSGFTQAGSLSSSPTSGSQQSSLSSSSSAPLEPSPLPAPSLSSSSSPGISSDKLPLSSNKLTSSLPKIEKIEYEIPITPILSNEPRHHYVIAPAVPHIVDFVQGPILLAPSISTIKARSLQEIGDKEKPLIAVPLPELQKPEALTLTNDLDKGDLLKDIDDKEKKSEFKRFLEANALKEDSKQDTLNLKDQIKLPDEEKVEKLNLEKTKLELKSAPIVDDEEDEKPQSKVA